MHSSKQADETLVGPLLSNHSPGAAFEDCLEFSGVPAHGSQITKSNDLGNIFP